jgi:hypothetical protein
MHERRCVLAHVHALGVHGCMRGRSSWRARGAADVLARDALLGGGLGCTSASTAIRESLPRLFAGKLTRVDRWFLARDDVPFGKVGLHVVLPRVPLSQWIAQPSIHFTCFKAHAMTEQERRPNMT